MGFWFRPSIPLIGQLPLDAVITRGENLRGIDVMLRGVAQQSFNYIVCGVLIGALVGFVLTQIDRKRQGAQ